MVIKGIGSSTGLSFLLVLWNCSKQMPQMGTLQQAMLRMERAGESVVREGRAHMLREIVRLERLAHPDKVSVSESELQDLAFHTFGGAHGSVA